MWAILNVATPCIMINKDSECPICFKESGDINWDVLLCADCKRELAEIRKRVIAINEFNDQSKKKINEVFSISDRLNSGEQVSPAAGKQDETNELLPMPSLQSIKALTTQLNKLDILRLNIRNKSIARNKIVVSGKVDALLKSVQIVQEQVNEKEAGISQKESQILELYERSTKSLDSRYDELKYNNVVQVKIQRIKLQHSKFKILKDMSFSSSKDSLLFFGQQILKIERFLNYNILIINQFLENLIRFQKQLAKIFHIKVPFLDDLESLLPNSAFYDLIKEKELFMTGKNDDSDEEEKQKLGEIIDNVEGGNSNNNKLFSFNSDERIIKLGNTIKLPLSSKTINNQRRASLGKHNELIKQIPVVKERSLSPTQSNNQNKKLIIIPHKILNKPFNKLYIKEFLKFLLVVVKIFANFKYILVVTDEIDNNESEPISYDFELILKRIIRIDDHFERQLSELNSKRAANNLGTEDKVDSTFSRSVSLNLKLSMEMVYNLIIDGSSRKPSTSSNTPINPNAPTLLRDLDLQDLISKQAKFHLEDWDVVSQVY